MNSNLELRPFRSRPDLLAAPVFSALSAMDADNVYVAEIDPARMGGEDFCATYGVDREDGANCVVLEAKRSNQTWYVATLVPVGHRTDIGGSVRRSVNARKLSVAPLEHVLEATQMEYGSITVIGLPPDWTVLVDERLTKKDRVFIGSGKARSKLMVPGAVLAKGPNFVVVPQLGMSATQE